MTRRSPRAPRRSSETFSSEAPIGVRALFFASSFAIRAPTAAGSRGAERYVEIGLTGVDLATEYPHRERRAGGNVLGGEPGQRLLRDVDSPLFSNPLQHAARGVENDLDGVARPVCRAATVTATKPGSCAPGVIRIGARASVAWLWPVE